MLSATASSPGVNAPSYSDHVGSTT